MLLPRSLSFSICFDYVAKCGNQSCKGLFKFYLSSFGFGIKPLGVLDEVISKLDAARHLQEIKTFVMRKLYRKFLK